MTGVDELLEKASARTGLDEFGEDSFLEGLTVLVDSLTTEARLNDVGEHVLFGKVSKLLGHRLEIEEWYRRHPEIDDEVLLPPLIGVGLPRTGSTALSNLLNEDPQARSLPSWLAMKPCPPPSMAPDPDPRVADAQESIDLQMQFAPQLAAMVPTSAQGPAECLELMALDFRSHVFGALTQIPTYQQWLMNDTDLHSTYRYERRVLKLLQWRSPDRPWRLKAPSHLCHIDALAEVFDDARFGCTHRDPAKVMPSCAGLYEATIAMFTDHVDRHHIGRQNLDTWSAGMERMMAFRADGGEERCHDIDHLEMQQHPIAAVERLYDWLGESIAPAFRAGMARWWQENAADRQTATYAPLEEYGLTNDEVQSAFRDYSERFVATPASDRGR